MGLFINIRELKKQLKEEKHRLVKQQSGSEFKLFGKKLSD